jgi:ABC-type lipoprotein release transport system permease subunit
MAKFYALIKLGVKYLRRHKRRYLFLMATLVFGFTVVTFITSAKDGMYNSVYYTAQSHYAGDIVAVGYGTDNKEYLGSTEISVILEAAEKSRINAENIVFRTIFGELGVVYFNGNAVRQKYIVGCDWKNEDFLFSKMDFAMPVQSPGDDGIFISTAVARQLGAAIGDSVILEVDTRYKQKNTGTFTVRGIFRDSSIFGYYKVYISRPTLNRLRLFDENDCTNIGFFLNNPSLAEQKRKELYAVLSERIQTGPLLYSRDEEPVRTYDNGTEVFLYTMTYFLSEVTDLMGALNIITYFLYGMMLVIILASASVTYRLIIYERSNEMGVMRAIGFYGSDLRLVLWTEAITLGVISLTLGFLFAWVLGKAASILSFEWFPSFEIFLKNGKLPVLYLPKTVVFNMILTILVLIAAVVFPSVRASRKNIPVLLSGEH